MHGPSIFPLYLLRLPTNYSHKSDQFEIGGSCHRIGAFTAKIFIIHTLEILKAIHKCLQHRNMRCMGCHLGTQGCHIGDRDVYEHVDASVLSGAASIHLGDWLVVGDGGGGHQW